MARIPLRELRIRAPDVPEVSALLLKPPRAQACFVFAHGAGADMNHAFMRSIATQLAVTGIATLRYQFPYTQAGGKRPDRPAVCHAVIRAAVDMAAKQTPGVPLIAGGKSFGGRMTSQAQALAPMPGVVGLAFLGFPWHLPGKPTLERTPHLAAIKVPMLFIQGTRDAMADPKLIKGQVGKRLKGAMLRSIAGADHGFHVLVSSGRTDAAAEAEVVEAFCEWVLMLIGRRKP